MTRNEAEKMIGRKLIEIDTIVQEYYKDDGYFTACIIRDAGIIHFNNTDWEHAVGKLNKTIYMKGGEWVDEIG